MAGRTIYFTDTLMAPDLEHQQTDTSNTWYSQAIADTSYNIRMHSVVFLDSANYQGYPVRRYIINGTCKALMGQFYGMDSLMTDSFNIILTRVTY